MENRGQGTPVSQGYRERRHGRQDEELRRDLSPRLNLFAKPVICYALAVSTILFTNCEHSTTLRN
jgi:hypothetical protein